MYLITILPEGRVLKGTVGSLYPLVYSHHIEMSIATLKKKTQHKYNCVSVGRNQFSLNGTHRSQGYVGQDTVSRSFPITPMRGNVAKGHGGCGGEYHLQNVTYGSGIHLLNDPHVVKSPVINIGGMMMNKYRGCNRTKKVPELPIDKNRDCALSTVVSYKGNGILRFPLTTQKGTCQGNLRFPSCV